MKNLRNINAMIIPTGIGASIGGFAGDAMPAAKLLAKASDLLITHPNVVNAALLTDIPDNIAVVEGYLLDRFFAEQIALRLNVKHKIAVIVDAAANSEERILTQNCINAATAVYGLDIIQEPYYTSAAIGAEDLMNIKNPETLLEACAQAVLDGATSFAVLAVLPENSDSEDVQKYLQTQGKDPIGFIEAKISHLLAQFFLKPCAHAPIIRSNSQASRIVHPRLAAEYLSESFLASVFKALQHSPQIIPLENYYKLLSSFYTNPANLGLKRRADDIMVYDLANLVVPFNACNNVPCIESHKHHIELICVQSNKTLIDDQARFFNLPHRLVANYYEAAGFLLANTKDKYHINLLS